MANRNIVDILISAKDEASGVFDSLNKKLLGIGAAIAGYFGVKSFVGAIEGAANLEAALSTVKAVSEATAEEMHALRQAAEDAGKNTQFTATNAAGALAELARSGLSAKDSMASLPAVMNLAQAGGIGLGQAAEYVSKTMAGFGLKAQDTGMIVDVLSKGANASNTSVTGVAEAMSYAAPIAKALGLSLADTVSYMGKFADGGVDASRAGTSLNEVLSQFAEPASKFRTEMGAIGITTGDFNTAIRQLAAAGPAGEKAIQSLGLNAGPAFRGLMNQGMEALDDLRGKLANAGGSAVETARIMNDNLAGSMKGLGSVWDSVKNALTTPVLPVLKDGVDKLSAAFKGAIEDGTITRWGESLAEAFKGGIEWVKNFVGAVDFTAVSAKLQDWASQAQAAFTSVANSAKSAGNVAQLAYGVMSAGTNTVQALVYGLGSAFATVFEKIQSGVALLYTALSKVTFGDVAKAYKQAADDMALSAKATGAAAEALAKNSEDALSALTSNADTARTAWGKLGEGAEAAAVQHTTSAKAIANVADTLHKMDTAMESSTTATVKAAAKQAAAFEATRAKVEQLHNEYTKAVDNRDWQAAAEIQKALTAAVLKTGEATKSTKFDLSLWSQEFKRQMDVILAGHVVRDADLKLQLASAKASEESAHAMGAEGEVIVAQIQQKQIQIKIIQETVRVMGEEAKANITAAEAQRADLIAKSGLTENLKAEIDLRIANAKAKLTEAEAAGKATGALQSEINALQRNTQVQTGNSAARADSSKYMQEQVDAMDHIAMRYKLAADYTEHEIALLERENAERQKAIDLENKRLSLDKEGFSTDKDGKRIAMGGDLTTRTGILGFLKSAGVTDEGEAKRITNEFADSKGEITYMENAGQKKYGGDTISMALLRAAEQFTFSAKSLTASTKQPTTASAATPTPAPAPITTTASAAPTSAPISTSTSNSTNNNTVNIYIDNSPSSAPQLVQNSAENLLKVLQQAKLVSA